MAKSTLEFSDTGFGNIYYTDSVFYNALRNISKESASIISLRDLAYARTQRDKYHSISVGGSYVKEGSLFIPHARNKRILLRESLALQNPSQAAYFHRLGYEYFPENLSVDKYLEQLDHDDYFVLNNNSSIPTNRFGEDPRTVWMFQDQAKPYGEFLANNAGISAINIDIYTEDDQYINSQSKSFANQLWLRGLDGNSGILGTIRGFNSYYRLRGLKRESVDDKLKK